MQVTDNPTSKQPVNEQDLKKQLIQQFNQKEVAKSGFPTEIIDLPSKGLLYPEGHPLASGKIEMKYMCAKEEDILSSPNLLKQGKAIDKLLESLIMTPVNLNEILSCDKESLIYAARILGYGKEYDIKYTCKHCKNEHPYNVDLTTFKDKELNLDKISKGKNEFSFVLPKSKRTVTFKMLTGIDETNITSELNGFKATTNSSGISRSNTTRIKYMLLSIDSDYDKNKIRNFVDNELFATDSLELKKYIASVTPGVNTSIKAVCPSCDELNEFELELDISFFWPRV